MHLNTHLIELEVHAGLLYVRLGRLDCVWARGQGWTFRQKP